VLEVAALEQDGKEKGLDSSRVRKDHTDSDVIRTVKWGKSVERMRSLKKT